MFELSLCSDAHAELMVTLQAIMKVQYIQAVIKYLILACGVHLGEEWCGMPAHQTSSRACGSTSILLSSWEVEFPTLGVQQAGNTEKGIWFESVSNYYNLYKMQ